MRSIWNPTIDDVLEAIELAKSRGKKDGESYEAEFIEVMQKKNKKPVGFTELTDKEMIAEQLSHGNKILEIETKDNKTNFKFYKPEENKDEL